MYRDELIEDYEELGSFKKVAKKWGVSITAVWRVIRNRMHTMIELKVKYGTRTYDENIQDEWTL
jgi:molybdenum-dependent DNA-binding transcriptional regulator ModE